MQAKFFFYIAWMGALFPVREKEKMMIMRAREVANIKVACSYFWELR